MSINVTRNSRICKTCAGVYTPTSNRQEYCPICKKALDKRKTHERYVKRYQKKGYDQRGESNNNWKGGTEPYYRRIAYEAYGKICSRCGATKRIGVHHKDRNRRNNDLENLEVLCKRCHQLEHACYKNLGPYLGAPRPRDNVTGRFVKTP